MIHNLKTIIKISRPKFWLYLAGTYLLGCVIGSTKQTDVVSFTFIAYFLFFLIPANIFLYGVNDYFDEDTDKYNDRKKEEEHLIKQNEKTFLRIVLFAVAFIGIVYFFLAESLVIKGTLVLFFILSYFYSSPPLRFKAKVILDSLSNILYILPSVIGYYQQSSVLPEPSIVIACFCWAIAMQLFSSIPDIAADKKAGLTTTAVVFGRNISLLLCCALWTIFSITIFSVEALFPFSLLLFIYPLIPLLLVINKQLSIVTVYKLFSYINNIMGFIFFIIIFLQKPFA